MILGVVYVTDALSFKPKLADFDQEDSEESEEEDNKTGMDTKSTDVYRPPRLAPVHYDGDKPKSKGLSYRSRNTLSSSRVLRELEEEYGETPEVRSSNLMDSLATEEIDTHFQEKETFEEDNFIRLNYTRQEKRMRKQRERLTMTDEVKQIVADLDGNEDGESHLNEMVDYLESKRTKVKRFNVDESAVPTLLEGRKASQNGDDYQDRKRRANRRLHRELDRQHKRHRKSDSK
jgi:hypothetical protein